MSESFLHYLWQFQYFNKQDLRTSDGEPVSIFHAGYRNTHAGPDFQDIRIKIGAVEWSGSAEIHINASGWIDHRHDHDAAYDTVALHVVWNNDKPVTRKDGSVLPTLELKNRVEDDLLLRYKTLANNPEEIPCATSFSKVSELTIFSTLDKMLTERLERKSKDVFALLKRNHNNWEETCYQLLAKNFGFKINADPFLQLAQGLPYKTVLKHADKSECVEALIFGQAGFLDDKKVDDEYIRLLKREYALLSHKYSLGSSKLNLAQWKFLRLRPANFPTIRLAQFAGLLLHQKNIVSKILEAVTYEELKLLFSVKQSDYWLHHYLLGKTSREAIAVLGEMSIDNIIVNTVAPLLVAYGKLKDDSLYLERAIMILQQVPSEFNFITRRWATVGIKSKMAFDSQGLIELYTNFCSKRRCLDCNIGASLLKPIRK
ncbi:DUF2851 family protein [Ohtaekwangia koreensis]|uniref:DUF2851 domain-containing protein n=1 Tax=Ohtaekwangia koreensis TaxID=688867 RepID=A0A1T5J204_9BACT|nr:DUF2851 family protein [Ohtaekwangia koreensis]SKC45351.1 Protein of unknown function [Ohtaekwangia koreensis]